MGIVSELVQQAASVANIRSNMNAITTVLSNVSTCNDLDIWDPNNWDDYFDTRDRDVACLPLDDADRERVILDEIDYQWATQWRWCARRHPYSGIYARRAVGENYHGSRLRTYTLYLHIEIMKRTGIKRPSRRHIMVDHRNGNASDDRRSNLRWATPGMNARNRWSAAPRDLIEG